MFTSLATLLTLSAYALASPIAKRQSADSLTTVEIDDNEHDTITYGGSWTPLTNQGDQWYKGTESYSNEPKAYYRTPFPGGGSHTYSLEIKSGLKNDRGECQVALSNGTVLDTVSMYADASEPTSSKVIFSQDNIYLEEDMDLIVSNKPVNEEERYYIAVDKITFKY